MDQFLGNEQVKSVIQGEALQLLTFAVGNEEYGVDIMAVNEIKVVTEVTHLPSMPSFMRGVTNLRGVIVPIFDLRARFGIEALGAHDKHVAIILSVGGRLIGISVDSVSDILNSHSGEMKPAPTVHESQRDVFVRGLISIESRMVIVLDVEHLFDKIMIENLCQAA